MAPFNIVDAMILCELSYYNYEGLVSADFSGEKVLLKDVCLPQVIDPLPNYCTKEDPVLLNLVKESQRFADIPVGGYVNKVNIDENMQHAK